MSILRVVRFVIACSLCGLLACDVFAQNIAPQSRVIEVNGIGIHFRTVGTGPPLLLLHGFTGSSVWWEDLLPNFQDDFTVIVPDLPGHGRSAGRPGAYRFDHVATDLHALLDELGMDQFHAIGYSGGGITLLQMAKQQPDRIKSMVIISAPHVPSKRDIVGFPQFQDHPPRVHEYWLKVHPEGKAQVESLIASFHALGAVVDKISIKDEELSLMEGRTLIIVGDQDPLVPLEGVMDMYQMLPNASLWVVPNQGHSAIWPEWGGSVQAASIFPEVVVRFLGSASQ